MICERTNQS